MNLAHHFLLAMPELSSDYFANTLTYICEHDDEGAMGLMINQPTTISLYELANEVGSTQDRSLLDIPIFAGGPVSTQQGFVLHSDDVTYPETKTLQGGLCVSASLQSLQDIANGLAPQKYLVALGYAGWGKGQLEQEIADNVWLTAPADPDLIFNCSASDRLSAAARSLGVDLSLLARAGHA